MPLSLMFLIIGFSMVLNMWIWPAHAMKLFGAGMLAFLLAFIVHEVFELGRSGRLKRRRR